MLQRMGLDPDAVQQQMLREAMQTFDRHMAQGGYYEGLRAQLTHMVKMGLCTPEKLENIHFAADLAEIKTILAKK